MNLFTGTTLAARQDRDRASGRIQSVSVPILDHLVERHEILGKEDDPREIAMVEADPLPGDEWFGRFAFGLHQKMPQIVWKLGTRMPGGSFTRKARRPS
ncbi:MAG TPA: hypothetical protein PLL33_10675 [Paracoccus sp. (in: a-proteobacteria)]|nr:hypothetical protein [Paracoccus sp. (in: a-proteobacteria)]